MDKVTISTYEFLKQFPNEKAARIYLEEQRWHGKPVCPYCNEALRVQVRKVESFFRCLACKKDFTVRTGTIFERSHVPLDKWLYAMYLLATARKGISSLQLSKELGVTQKTSWFMLQRIRGACKANDDFLFGIVEADEIYIGGKEINKHENKKSKQGRGAVGKSVVLGMRERRGKVRASVIKSNDRETIQSKIKGSVLEGSILCTDEHSAYLGMREYEHRTVRHSAKQYVDGMAHTNSIESVWALLKRGFYGVYHWFSNKHLQLYINEFTFRLNEGNCQVHTLDRINALIGMTIGKRVTYKMLIAAT